ncbi:MAG: hypothetical protein ABI461_05045 [Polyangiaceae bacterium]
MNILIEVCALAIASATGFNPSADGVMKNETGVDDVGGSEVGTGSVAVVVAAEVGCFFECAALEDDLS